MLVQTGIDATVLEVNFCSIQECVYLATIYARVTTTRANDILH